MKRLNKKGFTLVELLAVIVILAIVVGITLVTVLPTLKKSRQEAFELTAQTAADYFEKQYQLYLIGESVQNDTKVAIENSLTDPSKAHMIGSEALTEAGLKPENYIQAYLKVDSTTGRVCVKLYASTNQSVKLGIYNLTDTKEAGEYYDANTIFTVIEVNKTGEFKQSAEHFSEAKSSSCS